MTESGRYTKNAVWWNFEFPNNRGASVQPSKSAFRFDVDFDDCDGLGIDIVHGLTTDQVEALLGEIASSEPSS